MITKYNLNKYSSAKKQDNMHPIQVTSFAFQPNVVITTTATLY